MYLFFLMLLIYLFKIPKMGGNLCWDKHLNRIVSRLMWYVTKKAECDMQCMCVVWLLPVQDHSVLSNSAECLSIYYKVMDFSVWGVLLQCMLKLTMLLNRKKKLLHWVNCNITKQSKFWQSNLKGYTWREGVKESEFLFMRVTE